MKQKKMNPLDLSNARMRHLQWKIQVKNFLDGKASITQSQAVDHKQCDLGKWYYSEGKTMYGHIEEIQQFETVHEKLHALVKEIIRLKKFNETDSAKEKYKELVKASGEIFDLLEKAEKAILAKADNNLLTISV